MGQLDVRDAKTLSKKAPPIYKNWYEAIKEDMPKETDLVKRILRCLAMH